MCSVQAKGSHWAHSISCVYCKLIVAESQGLNTLMGSNHNDLEELHLCTVCMVEGHTLSLATEVLCRVAMYM